MVKMMLKINGFGGPHLMVRHSHPSNDGRDWRRSRDEGQSSAGGYTMVSVAEALHLDQLFTLHKFGIEISAR